MTQSSVNSFISQDAALLLSKLPPWTSQYHHARHAGSAVKSVRRTIVPFTLVAGAVAKQAAAEKNTEKTNAANGVNFWELKGFIQNENEKNIDHQIKIGLDQNFQNVVG